MEIIIVICLLIVIVLLAKDKIIIKKVVKNKQQQPATNRDLPEIMGKPKPVKRHALPTSATERQSEKRADKPDNFEAETKEKGFAKVIPQEELNEVFDETPDLYEEEEEWHRNGEPNGEDGFAKGVTFEELSTVGKLLQQEVLEASLQQQAVGIVHKIQGTELFSLLENSIENASQKIARLLDQGISQHSNSGSSSSRNKDLDGFDIGEFV